MRANFQIIFFPISVGQEPSVKERDPERNGNPYSSVVITESWLLFSRTVYQLLYKITQDTCFLNTRVISGVLQLQKRRR